MKIQFFFLSSILLAQLTVKAQMKIGNNPTTINGASLLELEATNKGLVFPRVSLTNVSSPNPLPVGLLTGTVVFNTNGSITNGNGMGLYLWNGSLWVSINTGGTSATAWSLTGNAGTNPSNNFLGTKDAVDFILKTSNTERLRILGGDIANSHTGWMGVGTALPRSPMDISVPVANRNVISIQNTSNSGYSSVDMYDNRGNLVNSFGYANPSAASSLVAGKDYFYFYGNDFLITDGAGVNNYNLFLQASTGYIGLNTPTPQQRLRVNGKFYLDSAFMPGGLAGTTGQVLTSAGPDVAPTWQTISAAAPAWSLTGNSGITYLTNFLGTTNNAGFRLRTNNIQRMVIDSVGSVGIGSEAFDATNRERLLVDYGVTTSGKIARFTGSINNPLQVIIQNISTARSATSDFVAVADDGTDATNFINVGINGSGYTSAPEKWGGLHDAHLYSNSRNLLIGTTNSTADVYFLVNGGVVKDNTVLKLNSPNGNIVVGKGDLSDSPQGNTIRGPRANIADVKGGSLTLQGGDGTGTAAGGDLNLYAGGGGAIGAVNIIANPLTIFGVQPTSSFNTDSILTIFNGVVKKTPYSAITGSISATAPLMYDNTTGVLSINQANTSKAGYLSSANWNTFNNKVGSISLTVPSIYNPVTFSVVSGAALGALSFINQNANTVFAGPASGGAAQPAFRTLGASDLPLATTTAVGGVSVGSGLSVTAGGVLSTVSNGTVTSVALSLPGIFTVTNSPVTSFGTLTGTLNSQSANLVFASPNGAAGAPSFRVLVAADIPTGSGNYIQNGTVQQASSNFNISGSGVIGGTSTLTGVVTSKAGIINTGAITSSGGILSVTQPNPLYLSGVVATSSFTTDSILTINAGVVKKAPYSSLPSGGGGSGWLLTGNSGTAPGTNFLGTTDQKDLVFKVNSVQAGFLGQSTQAVSFGIGASAVYQSTAIGVGAQATGANNSLAVGYLAAASKQNALAIGSSSIADFDESVAIGLRAHAATYDGIAIGTDAVVSSQTKNIAIGYKAVASVDNGIAIGSQASVSSNAIAMAIGPSATASGYISAAFGYQSQATGQNTLSLGNGAVASGYRSMALGNADTASADNTISIGTLSSAKAAGATVVGISSVASGVNSDAFGNSVTASGESSIGIGTGAKATQKNSTAFGSGAQATAEGANSFGISAIASGLNTTAIGNFTNASGANAATLGDNTIASSDNTIAIGNGSQSTFSNAVAIGYSAKSTAPNTIAFGNSAQSIVDNSIAFGYLANASATASTAIGNNSVASFSNAMAIGNTASANANYTLAIGNNAKASKANAVAVGYNTQATSASATAIGDRGIASGGNSTAIGYSAKAGADNSIAIGSLAAANALGSIAVGSASQATEQNALSYGNNNIANGVNSGAIGNNTSVTANNSLAIGNGTVVSSQNSIAIGSNITVTKPNVFTLGGTLPVNIGIGTVSPNNKLTVVGVNLTDNPLFISKVQATTTFTSDSILTINGGIVKAAPYSALPGSGGSGWLTTGNTGTTSSTNFVGTNDDQALVFKTNNAISGYISSLNDGQGKISLGYGASASDQYATALGTGATASANASLALGYNAKATVQNAIAMGQTSLANQTGTIAVGSAAQATNQGAMAYGNGATASGLNSAVVGNSSSANSQNTLVFGVSSKALADGASVVGYNSMSSGASTNIIGNNSTITAAGSNSFIIGDGSTVSASYSAAIGNSITVTQANAVILGNPAATVNIGIGTPTPNTGTKLDVNGPFKLGATNAANPVLNGIFRTTVTLQPGSIAVGATVVVSATVTGANKNATVILNPQNNMKDGLTIAWARVSAANTINVGFTGSGAAVDNPPSITYDVTIIQ